MVACRLQSRFRFTLLLLESFYLVVSNLQLKLDPLFLILQLLNCLSQLLGRLTLLFRLLALFPILGQLRLLPL